MLTRNTHCQRGGLQFLLTAPRHGDAPVGIIDAAVGANSRLDGLDVVVSFATHGESATCSDRGESTGAAIPPT